MSYPEQIQASLVPGDWDLGDELHQRLTATVPFCLGYPRDWIEQSWSNIAGREEFGPWEVQRPGSSVDKP